MIDKQANWFRIVVSALMSAGLFACAHHVPAPVINLSKVSSYEPGGFVSVENSQQAEVLPEYHEVEKGETLFSIAWSYAVDYRKLAEINDINNDYRIYPGQKLRFALPQIPLKVDSFEPAKLQIAVKRALELPIHDQDVNTLRKTNTSSISNHSPQKANKPVEMVISHKKNEKSSRQVVLKSVKGHSEATKIRRWYWPVKGSIVDGFSSKLHGNKGLDISGKPGQPVRAAAPGRVVYRGNSLKGYGNLVIVKHNDDYLSAYAHNSAIHVKENEMVKAGQVIADIGNSGADKPKLHFEIRYRGKPVDPIKYLPKL
ncbi:peptidoglycan DD-metalloendopeptidase family protein [Pleionea sediminis]|uniref:peptidoglycan DD-metalloendopeptidase family protein n=1 Tax=Pleionea sediminis TaxID=2569479 RepID=UPI00118693A5|nr:peptidoglycan DD-metalloendopeptidase family protein [Pleionea sediminis]